MQGREPGGVIGWATIESEAELETKGGVSWRGSDEDSTRVSDWSPGSNRRAGGLNLVLIGGVRRDVASALELEDGTLERSEISIGSVLASDSDSVLELN